MSLWRGYTSKSVFKSWCDFCLSSFLLDTCKAECRDATGTGHVELCDFVSASVKLLQVPNLNIPTGFTVHSIATNDLCAATVSPNCSKKSPTCTSTSYLQLQLQLTGTSNFCFSALSFYLQMNLIGRSTRPIWSALVGLLRSLVWIEPSFCK